MPVTYTLNKSMGVTKHILIFHLILTEVAFIKKRLLKCLYNYDELKNHECFTVFFNLLIFRKQQQLLMLNNV